MEERQKLRLAAYRRYSEWDGEAKRFWYPCPWCGEEVSRDAFDLHEVIVKRSAVPKNLQYLIFVPENTICLHSSCHIEHGNSEEMLRRCLPTMMRVLDAVRIGEWYVDLWRGKGLSVPRGMLLGRKEVSVSRCAELMWLGARLHGQLSGAAHAISALADEDWLIEVGNDVWDFRVLVAWRWQGHGRGSKKRVNFRRPPEEYMGISASRLEYFLSEGYWATYLCDVAGFAVEELLDG